MRTDEEGRLLEGVDDKTYKAARKKKSLRKRSASEGGKPYDVTTPGEDLYERTQLAKKMSGAKKKGPDESSGGGGSNAARSAGTSVMRAGAAQGGSGAEANIAGGALMATGNPAGIAAGAGLMVLAAGKQRKEREQNVRYQARVNRVERQQKALQSFMNSIQQGGL